MNAQPIHFGADAAFEAVLQDDVAVDRGGIERTVEFAGAVDNHWTKHGPDLGGMAARPGIPR